MDKGKGGDMMDEHPIQGLMSTAMQSIREMVDVNTIVGDAVQAPDGTVIIPISRVAFGFAAGGGEYGVDVLESMGKRHDEPHEVNLPFAGGSGGGVSICPVAFMVVGQGSIKLLPVNMNTSLERIIDFIPEAVEKINDIVKKVSVKKELKISEGAGRKTAVKKEEKSEKEDSEDNENE